MLSASERLLTESWVVNPKLFAQASVALHSSALLISVQFQELSPILVRQRNSPLLILYADSYVCHVVITRTDTRVGHISWLQRTIHQH